MSKTYVYNEKLKYARELRGWSQEELARRVGYLADSTGRQGVVLDVSTISRWERGRNAPSPFYRQLLCSLFEMNAEELGLLSMDGALPAEDTLSIQGFDLDRVDFSGPDNPYRAMAGETALPGSGLPEITCNAQTVPIVDLPEANRSNPIFRDGVYQDSTVAPSATPTPPFFVVHRRKFLAVLLASATLGGGVAIAIEQLQAHSRPVAPVAPVEVSRHWPAVTPDSRKKVARVRVIQWMLDARGWRLPVDGIFWVSTENAVMFFQENVNVPVTTTVSNLTWERLIVPSSKEDQETMYHGDQVKALQETLNIYGASPRLEVDGDFGPLTEAATRHFQQTHHLIVTGQADLNTWCLLVGGSLL